MIGPIRQGRHLTRQGGQFAVQEIAERLAQRVDVFAVAIDEIHRHIQGVIDIAFEPHAVLEHKGQHAGARVIQMFPDVAAPAFHAIGLAIQKRRIREQRGRNRLQSQCHAELLNHVRLGREIEVHLHGTGPVHHGFAHGADAVHVIGHQLIPALGHDRHLLMAPLRGSAQTDEADADLGRDVLDVAQVGVHLITGFVDRAQGRAGQFQLSARFQTDVRAVFFQSDQLVRLENRGPSVQVAQTFHHGQNRTLTLIREGHQGIFAVAEFLVLGPDAPILSGFASGFQIFGQLIKALDGAAARLRN